MKLFQSFLLLLCFFMPGVQKASLTNTTPQKYSHAPVIQGQKAETVSLKYDLSQHQVSPDPGIIAEEVFGIAEEETEKNYYKKSNIDQTGYTGFVYPFLSDRAGADLINQLFSHFETPALLSCRYLSNRSLRI